MQKLAEAQGEGDLSSATAPSHLVTVLTQLLVDQLEHVPKIQELVPHGSWLSANPAHQIGVGFGAHMNSLLLAADPASALSFYVPGTVYRLKSVKGFKQAFGKRLSLLVDQCCGKKRPTGHWKAWRKAVRPVLIEISPVCDVAQAKRVSSLLVAGLLVPAAQISFKKSAENITVFPKFKVRWPVADFPPQEAMLLFCHTFKITLPQDGIAAWLEPWFRLRDLPTTAIRNANAAHAARVGYVSVAD